MYLLVAPLSGVFQWSPVIPLALGGSLGALLPPQTPISHRRGETGLAQVRLELAATALGQTEQILSEIVEYPIDEEAIMFKAIDRACGCCPCRKHCPDLEAAAKLPVSLLHRPLVTVEDLHFFCRKRGRMLLELRRGQDQYRTIRADRDKQKEYRWALIQQYRFLCSFLQELSNQLPRRGENLQPRYIPSIAVRSAGLEAANGDPIAQYTVAYLTETCDDQTPPDTKKAGEWYSKSVAGLEKAAAEGHPAACLALAHMYAHGKGVEKNHEKAEKYMKMYKELCKEKCCKEKAECPAEKAGCPCPEQPAAN
jgi:hypothetical protein